MHFAGIILGRPTIVVFELADDELALFQHVNVNLQTKKRDEGKGGGREGWDLILQMFVPSFFPAAKPCSCLKTSFPAS